MIKIEGMINMDKNLLWELFRQTGKVEYYLKYKEVQKKDS